MTVDEYCRGIEAHLTRGNLGHLIRIVGPAFDMVRAWAEQGIPFKVACHGIDRTVERYYAKGPRRRPVRIEYCEADVLDAFDDWRRAVGVRATPDSPAPVRRRESLATHIRRAADRLTLLRGGPVEGAAPPQVRVSTEALGEVVQALDDLASRARGARGRAREAIGAGLVALDKRLLDAARLAAGRDALAGIEREADDQLAPFRGRMTAEAWQTARAAAIDQVLRERARLPVLADPAWADASDDETGSPEESA